MKLSKPTNYKWSIPGRGGKLSNVNCDQTTKWYHQSGSEWLRTANFAQSQLFQSFPTEVAQNDSEQPISPNSQLFQSFPTEVAQND